MKTSDLIQKLSADHQKKPFWKERAVLLSGWFGFNFLYYALAIIFFSQHDPKATFVFLGLSLLNTLIGWFLFTRRLNDDGSYSGIAGVGVGTLLGIIALAFFYDDFFAHNVFHERSWVVTSSDLICFSHTVFSALIPIVMASALMKYFFVPKKMSSVIFLSFHVTTLSILWTEMSCPDRQFWHLMMGHQSSILGVFALTIFCGYLMKRRASSAS